MFFPKNLNTISRKFDLSNKFLKHLPMAGWNAILNFSFTCIRKKVLINWRSLWTGTIWKLRSSGWKKQNKWPVFLWLTLDIKNFFATGLYEFRSISLIRIIFSSSCCGVYQPNEINICFIFLNDAMMQLEAWLQVSLIPKCHNAQKMKSYNCQSRFLTGKGVR